MRTKTHSVKAADIQRIWWVVDASGKTLGRVASKIATVLMGKDKPTYAPHLEVGDFVVVINADLVHTTGNKLLNKIYYRHSGYPGGLKSVTLEKMLADHPDRVLKKAVQGMLPKNKLGRRSLKRLHVYAGPEHPHAGQIPRLLEIGENSG
jgi:large subunit ribosomal protein L13